MSRTAVETAAHRLRTRTSGFLSHARTIPFGYEADDNDPYFDITVNYLRRTNM